jgi:hypothetical protein
MSTRTTYLYVSHPVECHDVLFFWPSIQYIYQKLNQSNISVLRWFYLVTATCFDPYLHHHQAVFLTKYLYGMHPDACYLRKYIIWDSRTTNNQKETK